MEMTLLMPFIIFLIWNLLFLSFFLYDQCTAVEGCYVTALRTERWLGSDGEKQVEADKKYEEAVASKMACAKATPSIEVGADVSVGCELLMNAPGSMLYKSEWTGRHKMKADEWKPVRFIRNTRKAKAALELVRRD